MSASEQRPGPLAELAKWHGRQWVVAVASSLATVLFVGIPTDLIDTSMFSRQVPPPWWSYPSLAVSSVLAGLLIGTYATGSAQYTSRDEGRWGGFGGVLAFFAVGCPVCNKVVLLAVGTSGALQYFEPVQPLLALSSFLLLGWALHRRLRNTRTCSV
jgi:hypothetical protein